ncbi:glycosyltransferase family 2 protein [Candidatus Saccharibacteria bacterium]|nr:glycosyltransferase family 2 protein [Candidatus Saccharibacteria bacterium]
MEMPLISIIVPVYNVLPYLEQCFDSLIHQNYPNLEFIIIDDGSTDGSGVFCDEKAKTDARIIVIHQENKGLSAARNRGLAEAKGEYITFLDSDDWLEYDAVHYLYSLISKYECKTSICAISELTTKGNVINYGAEYGEKNMSTEEAMGRMLREEGFNVSAYAKLYKKELWQGIIFPEGAVHEDLGTTYKLIKKCPNVAYGGEPKYHYRKRQGSISSSGFSEKKFDIIKYTDEMCDDLAKYFPYLKNTIDLRRMHARFSVLWMIMSAKVTSPDIEKQKKSVVKYLRDNHQFVTKNPIAKKRDKVAIYLTMIHPALYKIAWSVYSKIRP